MTQKLNGSGMFVQQEHTGNLSTDGHKSHPKHKQVMFADKEEGENMDQYKFGTVQAGSQGTLVPVSTRQGGIEGSPNAYGKVVAGSVITTAGDGKGEATVKQFIPKHILDKSQLPKNIKKRNGQVNGHKMVQRVYLGGEGAEHAELDKELDALIGEESYESPEHLEAASVFAAQAPDPSVPQANVGIPIPQPVPANQPTKMVIMQGAFGKSRGKYTQVCIDNSFVVLVYDLEASVFTPPASKEVFALSCENQEYPVYFAGIEFELPFMNSGVQVMVRKET